MMPRSCLVYFWQVSLTLLTFKPKVCILNFSSPAYHVHLDMDILPHMHVWKAEGSVLPIFALSFLFMWKAGASRASFLKEQALDSLLSPQSIVHQAGPSGTKSFSFPSFDPL